MIALPPIPLVKPGDDLVVMILDSLEMCREALQPGDALVIAQKIVSKAEGRTVQLATIAPSPRAGALAEATGKDPRLVEVILSESVEVVRYGFNVIVVAHRLGFVMANAGVDQSNVAPDSEDSALLLPRNPDASCALLRARLLAETGVDVGVIINDSHGRAWRNGTVGVALGAAGVPGVVDLRGQADLYGRILRNTEVGVADELASAASLLMGQASESRPIVLARGIPYSLRDSNAQELVRPRERDLFR